MQNQTTIRNLIISYLFNGGSLILPQRRTSYEMGNTIFDVNYTQSIDFLDNTTINIGGHFQRLDYQTEINDTKNLDYYRQTTASFAEVNNSKGKWDFTLGLRGEDYDIGGIYLNPTTNNIENLRNFKKYKLFPNMSVLYNFTPMLNLSFNYNKKIELPSISELNPNYNYSSGNVYQTGNAHLQPSISDNFSINASAYNYFFINYNYSLNHNLTIDRITRHGDVISLTKDNISTVKFHNFALGFPFPFAIFNKPLKNILQENPNNMSYLHFIIAYNLPELPDVKKQGFWYYSTNGQIVLPKGIKLNLNYSIVPKNGSYFYFAFLKPIQHTLNLTLSKKFLENKLTISVFANDIFNTHKVEVSARNITVPTATYIKADTRKFGISVNYKIPTRNRLAKENQNILMESKDEEKKGFLK